MTSDAVYDAIGRSYCATRRPDPRIVTELVRLLECPLGSAICDVGAGSGNYTNALADVGFDLLAVEPSGVMRRQASPHGRVTWYEGTAEAIPLPAGAASAVVCTLAVHHFRDTAAAFLEMARVCPEGPFVVFTMDPRRGQVQWFSEYFPEIREQDFQLFPPVDEFARFVAEATGRRHEVASFPLPRDLSDHFMYAPWASPEVYLDATFRANTSGFATSDQEIVRRRLGKLAEDLASGRWDEKFACFRTLEENDAGYCFVAFRR